MHKQLSYAEFVSALSKPGEEILSSLNHREAHLLHMALGLAGEVGELIDALKKFIIYRRDPDFPNIIEELGDIEFYLQGIRNGLNLSHEVIMEENIRKLSIRYGEKYSDSGANERRDKE